jgi:hypothetical protein
VISTSLAKNIPKAASLTDVEDGGYIFLFIIGAVIILGIVFYPAQIGSIFSGLFSSFLAPAVAFIGGIANFVWSLVQGVLGLVGKAATGAGTFVWNHTIGALFITGGIS